MTYDPVTGLFARRSTGTKAGGRAAGGYVEIRVEGCRVYAHRLAWFMAHGEWPVHNIDHINGDKADNRIANLRDVPQADNRANTLRAKGRSGLVGVSWHKGTGKWVAKIQAPAGAQRHLGLFATPEEARAVYLLAKAPPSSALPPSGDAPGK